MKTYLGLELGSTRIKAVAIDTAHNPVSGGSYQWASRLENGIWTYDLAQVWEGIRQALSGVEHREAVACMGVSAMMHGYLAFDEDWNLLVPFRTWQNTMTAQAAAALTEAFRFNMPQRWSTTHLYQAILNKEEHVPRVAHITTLAGYVHFMLTGVNAVGIGEASGIFPIDSTTKQYDAKMLETFDRLSGLGRPLIELLPKILMAGEAAGKLSERGSALLGGLLKAGVAFAPAEGDAGTGMTATNAVAPRTGNVSAGTSIFSMIVLERPLKEIHPEICMVTTPTGAPVAMVHCANCTGDSNAWFSVLGEAACDMPQPVFNVIHRVVDYQVSSVLPQRVDVTYTDEDMSGEAVTHLDAGRPMVVRRPEGRFTLANFLRATLYSTMATLKIGMDILEGEQVAIDSLTGHGGLFKTPLVGQRFLAAACKAPVTVMQTAGEGGPYGMALLAAYAMQKREKETLEQYLNERVFATAQKTTVAPDPADVDGFTAYMEQFHRLLAVEKTAIERMN